MSAYLGKRINAQLLNIAIVSYVLLFYGIGLWLLLSLTGVLNAVLGILFLTHTRIWAAYLLHDLMHGSLLKLGRRFDRALAAVLIGILGCTYSNFKTLQKQHLRHHARRADIISFDFKSYLINGPRFLKRGILLLEWFYIPAVDFFMVIYAYKQALFSKDQRYRVAFLLLIRLILFGLFAFYSPLGLLCYFVSTIIFLTVLRLVDAYQHTFNVYFVDANGNAPSLPNLNKTYEQAHTYSNLLSQRYSWLNLLVLNFVYHNAHHEQPQIPWFGLPKLHKELYGENHANVLPWKKWLPSFHYHRITRILERTPSDDVDRQKLIGDVGVSFLY